MSRTNEHCKIITNAKVSITSDNAYTSLHTKKTKKSQANSVKSKQGQTLQMLDLQKHYITRRG